MLEQLDQMEGPVLQRLLRRTVLASLAVGGAAIVVALAIAPPLATIGIVAGLGVAILNLRQVDAGVARLEDRGDGSTKQVKRKLRMGTATRLGVITIVAIGLLLLSAPLGVGMVVGLVIFQILFVINVARIVFAQGGLA